MCQIQKLTRKESLLGGLIIQPAVKVASTSPMTQLLSGATRQSEAWMSSKKMAAIGTIDEIKKDFKRLERFFTIRLEGLHVH